MSFLQKAKEAAAQAAAQARQGQGAEAPTSGWGQPAPPAPGEDAPAASGWTTPGSAFPPGTPESEIRRAQIAAAAEHAKGAFGMAKKGLAGVIDKIDAGTMADIVIRATALQEKTNKALRLKGSPYRIAEISISASLPPAVSFAISRVGDSDDEEVTGEVISSTDILEEAGDSGQLVLQGPDGEATEAQVTT